MFLTCIKINKKWNQKIKSDWFVLLVIVSVGETAISKNTSGQPYYGS